MKLYHTENEDKSSVVERWNKTMKNRMWKMFSTNNNTVYWDKLDKLFDNYNNTSSISSLFTAHCYANEVSRHTNPSNFGMMKVNSGHHSGHPNRNIRYYDSEGNDYDKGEGGEPILGELSYPNKSSAVLRVKSVECSA